MSENDVSGTALSLAYSPQRLIVDVVAGPECDSAVHKIVRSDKWRTELRELVRQRPILTVVSVFDVEHSARYKIGDFYDIRVMCHIQAALDFQ
jgi:hypothetical protein